jgi:hypothetical protein
VRRSRSVVALTAAVVLLLGGCGSDGAGPGPYGTSPSSSPTSSPTASPTASQVVVPTAEELAAALVTTDAYEGTWTVNVPPDQEAAVSGVVSEAQQEMLPRIELCEQASEESRAAARALRWQAFRQLDQSEADPVDMAGGDRRGHLVFVQEFLMAGEPAEVETTFEALRDGMRACEGAIPAGEEGPGTAEPMSLPAVGEDRYGELTTMEEAGGGAYWLLHNAVVRRGPVLMSLQVVDIVVGEDVQPSFTTEDVGTFVTTAVDKLP